MDKSSCISITYFHYDRTHKVPGSLQTNGEKQFLPKQHERSVVKVALYCLRVRKYQKLGCQYNLNSTFLCIFVMIKPLITWSPTLFSLFSLSRASASFKVSDGLNKAVYIYLLQHPAIKVLVSILHYWSGKLPLLYLELQRQDRQPGSGYYFLYPKMYRCWRSLEQNTGSVKHTNILAWGKGTNHQWAKVRPVSLMFSTEDLSGKVDFPWYHELYAKIITIAKSPWAVCQNHHHC